MLGITIKKIHFLGKNVGRRLDFLPNEIL